MFFHPLYSWILRFVRIRHLASLLTILLIFLLIFGPLSYVLYLLLKELTEAKEFLDKKGLDVIAALNQSDTYKRLLQYLSSFLRIDTAMVQKQVEGWILSLPHELFSLFKERAVNVLSGFLSFFFMMLALFFFLEEGSGLLSRLIDYLPLRGVEKERIVKKTQEIVFTTIYGGILIAIAQALIAGVAFLLLGVPSPILFAVSTFIASFVPVFGTFTVWGPLSIYMFIKASVTKGLVLTAVGVFGISLIDNILRPIIIRGKMGLPIVIIFFTILGGVRLFGFIGVFLGPLIVSLLLIVLEIVRAEGPDHSTSITS
jgi:predicted PurR-regulated permease PerM